jgi:hypothetical protein
MSISKDDIKGKTPLKFVVEFLEEVYPDRFPTDDIEDIAKYNKLAGKIDLIRYLKQMSKD